MLDDSVSAPRGLAVKVIGVKGERLPGSEADVTQDFVLANAPAFAASDPKSFLKTLKMLAMTTDAPQAFKKAMSGMMRAVETTIEAFGGKSATAISLGGQKLTHILGEPFYSQTPFLYGSYVAKISIVPVSPALIALTDAPVKVGGRADAHLEEVNASARRTAAIGSSACSF